MIYTCTITPSVDYTTYLPSFENGKLNRTSEVFYYPGGKGINVSRVLKRLGARNKALGFIGGFTGNYIEDFLLREGVETDFIETAEITRINVKIKAAEETELNGPGPALRANDLAQLTEKINNMEKGDWLVLAGSLPAEIPLSYFSEIAERCSERQIRFVLDTSGPALKELVKFSPFLIKPNIHELGELFDAAISTKAEALHYAKKLAAGGVENVIVSMGGDGALWINESSAFEAKAPIGKVVNTVGSGDSLVSGFIASYCETEDPLEAFKYGVASGSATAFRSDLCRKEDVEALAGEVHVKEIKHGDVIV